MKKIAHICTSATSYKILCDKLQLLKSYGYDIHLISSKEGLQEDLLGEYTLKFNFVEMKRHISLIDDLKSIINLTKLFKKERYDVVHTHTAKAGVIGRVAAKLSGVPTIIHTYHGLPFYNGQNRLEYEIYKVIEFLAISISNALASQNKEDKEVLDSITNKPVYYEGNGVDLKKLDQIKYGIKKVDIEAIRRKFQISSEKKVLFVGARFEPVKDHFFLLEGLKELKKSYTDFVCLLAGKGPLEKDIMKMINDYNLNENVKMIGFQTDVYPFIYLSDIVLLTSQKEGIPRILMEAMAYSKPVIGTDVLGTRELILHKKTGLLVPYRDIKKLATSLLTLLQDKNERNRYGRNARKRIERHFTEESVARRIHEYYRMLLNSVT